MKLLLDTNVLCALLANPECLATPAREAIDAATASGEICVSVASALQLRQARANGLITAQDLRAFDDWAMRHQAQIIGITMAVVASMSERHSAETLADQLILATARTENCRLATLRELDDPDIECFVVTTTSLS